jgi:S-formylglutathione hydrolase FrmB
VRTTEDSAVAAALSVEAAIWEWELDALALFVAGGNGQPSQLDPAGTGPDGIEQFVHCQTADFVRRIGDLRIPATIDLYGSGTHTWPYWQRELHRNWPLLTSALRHLYGGAHRSGGRASQNARFSTS